MSQGRWVVMTMTQYAIMMSARSVISAARVSVDVWNGGSGFGSLGSGVWIRVGCRVGGGW